MNNHRNPWGEREPRVLAQGDAATVNSASASRTRRSFLLGAAAAAGGYGLWKWIDNSAPIGQLQAVLRRSLRLNAALDQELFGERGLAPVYPLSKAVELRLNGVVGLEKDLVLNSWRLQLAGVTPVTANPHYVPDLTAWTYQYAAATTSSPQPDNVKTAPKPQSPPHTGSGPAAGAPTEQKSRASGSAASTSPTPESAPASISIEEKFNRMAEQVTHKRRLSNGLAGESASSLDIGTPGLLLPLAELQKLPKVDLITEFKCVEGWSQITQWAGYRLRDFIEAYPPARINGRDPRYLYMETPDGSYYAGYSMLAARHPQSLLVTEMSGKPLTSLHGAPLRLHMPIKYGYKQLKRIGLISYTDTRPDDFWAKLGYDWYAGL